MTVAPVVSCHWQSRGRPCPHPARVPVPHGHPWAHGCSVGLPARQAPRAPQRPRGCGSLVCSPVSSSHPPFLSPAHSAPHAVSLPGVAPCLGAPPFQKHSCTRCCLGRLSTEPFVLAGSLQQAHWETGLARGVVFRELGQLHGSRLSLEPRELASLGLDSR